MSSSSLFSAPDLTNLIPDAEREEGVKYVFPVQVHLLPPKRQIFVPTGPCSLAPPSIGQIPAHLLLHEYGRSLHAHLLLPQYDRSLLTCSRDHKLLPTFPPLTVNFKDLCSLLLLPFWDSSLLTCSSPSTSDPCMLTCFSPTLKRSMFTFL